mgnify:CR=1 FL=1
MFIHCYSNKNLCETVSSVLFSLTNQRNAIIVGEDESGITQVARWCAQCFNKITNEKQDTNIEPNEKRDIMKLWSLLSLYEEFNQLFESELFKALENSYFEYSPITLSLYEQNNRKKFLEEMKKCPNKEVKYLFHGTQIEPISKIISNGFLYSRKTFYGMGIGFSDMLDYVSFFSGGKDFYSRRENWNKIHNVNETFSCVAAEIYYDKIKKRDIYDFSFWVETLDHFPTYEEIKQKYPDKMVEKNGIHFARVEPNKGRVRKREEIIKEINKGKFLANEYVITEFAQILPLYGLNFKRNEYCIIWRDPHFKGSNLYYKYLEEKKLFIYEYAKINAYFESSIEKALELIKRKKYNKIILISNIGFDLSGKRFIEIARTILGFNVMVLFFSKNKTHLPWIQNFPNALFTDNENFLYNYILNYNEAGLLDLKKKIEDYYNIKLKYDKDFLKFPKYIESGEYDDICFEELMPNFKKVIINQFFSKFCLLFDIDMFQVLNHLYHCTTIQDL